MLFSLKHTICAVMVLAFLVRVQPTLAQLPAHVERLYEQASEVSGMVIHYQQDVRAIQYAFGPMNMRRNAAPQTVYSPTQLDRLEQLDRQYLQALEELDFDNFSVQGQVDYILLKRKLAQSQRELAQQRSLQGAVSEWIPFAPIIYEIDLLRRRGNAVDGKQVAEELSRALKLSDQSLRAVQDTREMNETQAAYLESLLLDLNDRLASAYSFYNDYDPNFSWWVPAPYRALESRLDAFAKVVREKANRRVFDDGSNIGGEPIGPAALSGLLLDEMIPYTPEELLRLAEQEFAWCEAELLKASREMGFGDDWRAAQEQVKNAFVEPGKQPEMIIQLNQEALDFIQQRDLLTIPALSHDTWGMVMMSPEQQAVSPFFLGGRNILIAYPTSTMSHEQKMMSMRGNNPYFARGIVQHELVPGHHLQYFMGSRYKSYRGDAFRTPFWTEGWTLYWELLLYDLGFPKTPEERIGMLFWRMHRCARITFSINFHLGKWTPQQCIDYLVERVGHEPSTAHGEVKRSFEGNYGPLYQLAYLVGGLQVWHLKQELVDRGSLTIKEFHDRFMKENYMPIEMLRALLKGEPLSRNYQSNWRFYPLFDAHKQAVPANPL